MKTFRAWLLILLVLLLPLRGALAAGMLCEPGGRGHHEVSAQVHAAGHQHEAGGTHDHAVADKCNLCSASCSVTGPISTGVTVAVPQPASAKFEHLHAPPPSFFSDGQERPPRST